jgi:gamma-glutamylcyclotransferase
MTTKHIYFGYGSNMWRAQMKRRCPDSKLIGLGRLTGWKWIISERRYANVVQVATQETSTEITSEVWGLIWELSQTDFERLDVYEGYPEAYIRKLLDVDLWDSDIIDAFNANESISELTSLQPQTTEMWVYIDPWRISLGKPYAEYIGRMNNGIHDALELGLPQGYVDKVLRPFIPGKQEGKTPEQSKTTIESNW